MLPVKNKAPDGQTALRITTKELDTPGDNESGVRLSRSCELYSSAEEDVVKFVREGLSLDLKTQRRFELLSSEERDGVETLRFPTVNQVIEAFSQEDFDHVLGYRKQALILASGDRHYIEYLLAIAKHHAPGIRIAGLEKACVDHIAPALAHYVSGKTVLKDAASVSAEKKARDNEDTNPFMSPADSDDLLWGSGVTFTPYIVEAPHRVMIDVNDPSDSLLPSLIQRNDLKKAVLLPNEQEIIAAIYAHLAMQFIERGIEMLDQYTFTMLNGEPHTISGLVPIAHCENGRPTIQHINPEVDYSARGRHRRVLRGKDITVY